MLLVQLQAEACNFIKSNTPPSVFFSLFKLFKRYKIAQSITSILRFFSEHFFNGTTGTAFEY